MINFSLFLTRPPILMISTNMLSSYIIFTAWGNGTDLARSLRRSLARMMLYGSQVYLVVFTEMEPSIRFNSPRILNFLSSFFTSGQISLIYFSLYCGKRHEKLLSSIMPFGLCSGLNSSTTHLSRVGSLSHGFSFLNLLFLFTTSTGSFASAASVVLGVFYDILN